MAERLPIEVGTHNSTGRRQRNEDWCGYQHLGHWGMLAVVADGVGGEFYGHIASQLAVDKMIELYPQYAEANPALLPKEIFREVIREINHLVYEDALKRNVAGRMGTTITAALVDHQNVLRVAWVGDSPLYIINRRLQKGQQITVDHTEEQAAKELLSQGITPDVAPRKNRLTRSIGGAPNVEPGYIEGSLEAQDVIVIGTDGLMQFINRDALIDYALKIADPKQAAYKLVETALENGSNDNATAVIIHLGTPGDPDAVTQNIPGFLNETGKIAPVVEPEPVIVAKTGSQPVVQLDLPQAAPPLEGQPTSITPNPTRKPLARIGFVLFLVAVVMAAIVGGLIFLQRNALDPQPTLAVLATEATPETTVTAEATTSSAVTFADLMNQVRDMLISSTQTTIVVSQTVTASTEAETSPEALPPTVAPTNPPTSAGTTTAEPTLALTFTATVETTPTAVMATATLGTPTPLRVVAGVNLPAGTRLMVTVQFAPVYLGANDRSGRSYSIYANNVVEIVANREGLTYVDGFYHVRTPNGPGWVKETDLALLPDDAITPTSGPPSLPVITARPTAAPWFKDFSVAIKPDVLDAVLRTDPTLAAGETPLAAGTAAVIMQNDTQLVEGDYWWKVRLTDGREGWIAQRYLQAR